MPGIMMSSSTRSGGVRAAICKAISPFIARLSLWSAFRPSTRMSRFALASSTIRTRQSDRFFMGLGNRQMGGETDARRAAVMVPRKKCHDHCGATSQAIDPNWKSSIARDEPL